MIHKSLRNGLRKNLTYYHLHVTYFILTAFLGSLILWSLGTSRNSAHVHDHDRQHKHFPWIDCIYTIISGLCQGGFSAVPIEDIPAAGQVLVMLTMIIGGPIFFSVVPLLVRKHRYCRIVRTSSRSSASQQQDHPAANNLIRKLARILSLRTKNDRWMKTMASKKHLPEAYRVIFLEHQAICAVTDIVVWYYLGVQLFGFLVACACILCDAESKILLQSKQINVSFFALFAVVSAFSNTGFLIVNENMVALNSSSFLLLDLTIIILLGNTLFPVALRGIISLLHRFSEGTRKEVYALLLDHPRKYYRHLFPRTATLWLFITVAGFNSLAALVFYILDRKLLTPLSSAQKLINGIFQSANARNGGMNSMNLVDLSPALLFLYCVMMYVDPYPVSLKDEQCKEDDTTLCTQSKRILANDRTYLFLLSLLISVSLHKQLRSDPRNFNIFNIVFEVSSAYGCVGLTVGYSCDLRLEQGGPCKDAAVSFSGRWGVPGKIFIMLVMLIGRHRGLPDRIESISDSEKTILLLRRPSFIALTQQQALVEVEASL